MPRRLGGARAYPVTMERFERTGTVVDPRQSLAMWLRAGRARRKLGLHEVARITKIQTRILEKLESGHLDGLPAEVFVRGFIRSFARCVGLDEAEAVERYGECAAAKGASTVARAADAVVEATEEGAVNAESETATAAATAA